MRQVIVGRRDLNSNGEIEYFSRSNGDLWIFNSIEDAETALRIDGYTEEEIASFEFIKSNGICERCKSPLFPSDIKGYQYQCFSCDEDFFSFEQARREKLRLGG